MKNPEHGIKEYAIQDSTLTAFYKIPSKSKAVFSTKTDNRNFIDDHVKNTKWVPPAKYIISHDWSSNFGKRGKWAKGSRITSTQSEQNDAKKKNIPAPSHYKLKSQIEIDLKTVSHDAKSEKCCSIIEEARFRGSTTPGHKYNQSKDYAFYTKTRTVKVFPEPKEVKDCDNRLAKIKKDRSKPAEGDYKFMTGFNYCQRRDRVAIFKGNEKIECCAREYAKSKKWVPGPSHYNYEAAYAKLSKSPLSCRVYRH